MSFLSFNESYFYTQDGARLHFIDSGEGPVVLMLPAWSQSAEEFNLQILGLNHKYRMLSLDFRGHGLSQQVEYGYRIPRFAKDVRELIDHLQVKNVVLLGHGMGAAVALCYWDMFGEDSIAQLIIVDMSPVLVSNPVWSRKEKHDYGALVDSQGALEMMNIITSALGNKYRTTILNCMITDAISEVRRFNIIKNRLTLPLNQAAMLFYSNYFHDWRDVFSRIRLPCLVISGKGSITAWRSQQWIDTQLLHSKLVYFEENEGGKHFMFIENPLKFNCILDKFIQSQT